MGQKVSPVGLRVGINKGWDSNWYADKEFADFLHEDIQIRNHIETKLKEASLSNVSIERKEEKIYINIHTAKPGIVIGRGGEDINKLKVELTKFTKKTVNLNVVEVKNSDLVAKLVAEGIAKQIENRVSFRVAQKRTIQRVLRNREIKGIKTLVSGRLGGADMARSEGYTEGNVPLHTLRADIDYALAEADTTYGKIGVKVWLYKGEVLPTKANTNAKGKKEGK
ncbi:MAG: 30S ribosomal protein S3 [Bacilli bacterium]